MTDVALLLEEVRALRVLVLARSSKPSAFSLSDAARELGVGLSTLKGLIRRQVLLTVRVGRRRLVPMSEIEKFLQVSPGPARHPKTKGKTEGEKVRAALRG